MHKRIAVLAIAALMGTFGVSTFAAVETVKGRLVDMGCYLKDAKNNLGAEHKECAQTCAKKGLQVALVVEEGARRALPGQPNTQNVYVVTGPLTNDNNAKLVPHMSHVVELTGNVTWKDGIRISATDLKHVAGE